jgi:propanol-preferring alcohol dehydrogenase
MQSVMGGCNPSWATRNLLRGDDMRALRMVGFGREPELMEIPEPTPGPGEVVIKVGGAGACHSDLHILYELDVSAVWGLPMTLGHETAGWVHSMGSGVEGLSEGDPVAVYGAWGCGLCPRCAVGLGLNGGMADYLLVPHQRHLVALPDGLEPATAAPLTDAGLTPYHAIRRSWPKLTPDATCVMIGAGGLGHVGVQIARATTAAQVIAVDVKPEALELARKVGAHHAVRSDDSATAVIRELTNGRGADVVIDFVGATATLELARSVIRNMGDLTLVGIGGGEVPLSFFSQPYAVSIATTYWGSRPELVELLALAATGQVGTERALYSLDDGVRAYRDLHDGTLTGRAVVIP